MQNRLPLPSSSHLVSNSLFNKEQPPKHLRLEDRPQEVKDLIDYNFNRLVNREAVGWGVYSGDIDDYITECGYDIFGIDAYDFLVHIIQQNPDRNDFYVLDVGAGNFGFSHHLAKKINKNTNLRENIRVHLIGTRGEPNLEEAIFEKGKCKFYQFGTFKIESTLESFKALGFDFQNKIDLLVSHWCFQHLVDPIGVFMETYSLLRTGSGYMMMQGYNFLVDQNSAFLNMDFLLLLTGEPVLIKPFSSMHHHAPEFILKRTKDESLKLPISYGSSTIDEVKDDYHIIRKCKINYNTTTLEAKSLANCDEFKHHRKDYEVIGDPTLAEEILKKPLFYEGKTYFELGKERSYKGALNPAPKELIQANDSASCSPASLKPI